MRKDAIPPPPARADADEMFLMSLLPDFKEVPRNKQASLKLALINTVEQFKSDQPTWQPQRGGLQPWQSQQMSASMPLQQDTGMQPRPHEIPQTHFSFSPCPQQSEPTAPRPSEMHQQQEPQLEQQTVMGPFQTMLECDDYINM